MYLSFAQKLSSGQLYHQNNKIMSSKVDVLAKVNPTMSYIGTRVKELVNEVTCEDAPMQPSVLKKGDVIRVRIQADGTSKPRPSCVIKVCKDYVVSIPLTSCNDTNALCETSGSRFFKEGYFCNIYIVTPIERATFIGIYDNMKALNNAISLLKDFVNKNT